MKVRLSKKEALDTGWMDVKIQSALQREFWPMTRSRTEVETQCQLFSQVAWERAPACARLPVCKGEATKKGQRNSTSDSA